MSVGRCVDGYVCGWVGVGVCVWGGAWPSIYFVFPNTFQEYKA